MKKTWLICGILILILLGGLGLAIWIMVLNEYMKRPCRISGQELEERASFPIDLVYTWVDGTDEAWRAKQDEWLVKEARKPHSKDRDPVEGVLKDELYYSILSAFKHMPWLNKIFILSQKPQRPKWIETSPHRNRIRVFHHEDVFGPKAQKLLPAFNGILNTAQLHRIPGLAEHFIYSDDDFFIGKDLGSSHFFHPKSGLPVYTLTLDMKYYLLPIFLSQYDKILKQTDRMVRRYTQSPWGYRIHHLPTPLLRSVCQSMEGRIGNEIEEMGRFRTPKTFEYPSLVMNQLLASGQSYRHHPSFKSKFFNKPKKVLAQIKRLRNQSPSERPSTFCINKGYDERVGALLGEIYE